jgi:PelA/Pel-15E family pectate lyase
LGLLALTLMPAACGRSAENETGLRAQAHAALRKAAHYYHSNVASHGGYAYFYSEDLKGVFGEGVGTPNQIWVQPPGTPAVGLAYLKAYSATGDRDFLSAAQDVGKALAYGQLKSGGWSQTIDFDPNGTRVSLYRNGKGKGRNYSSLDDGQTQTAIQFMAKLDKALEYKDSVVHESATFAIDSLLKAQFPNGAFPQGWNKPVAAHPIMKARYPETWPRTWPNEDYWDYYTLNDGLAGTVSDTLIAVIESYPDDRYKKALAKLGDFLILAQMPDPQPAWAQQYNYNMEPIWARKFEPAAVSGWESQDVIETLMKVYRVTGDRKYLEPIPRALAYLKKSQLPDGQMNRYYELQTNRPLYMNRTDPKSYFLTYSDKDLPDHYGWKQASFLDRLQQEYDALIAGKDVAKPKPLVAQLEKEAQEIIAAMDDQGRWVSTYAGQRLVGQPKFKRGFRYLDMGVFNQNMETLSEYLAATRPVA